jgi:hypothetical protein
VSDPLVIERLSNEPILVEPLTSGAPIVVLLPSGPGPFGPISMAKTAMTIIVDGLGGVIMPGIKADLPAPFNGRITGWELLGDLAGAVTVDIQIGRPLEAVAFASICGGNQPSLTAVDAGAGDAVGWNSDISNGDVVRYIIDDVQTIRRLSIALFVERD